MGFAGLHAFTCISDLLLSLTSVLVEICWPPQHAIAGVWNDARLLLRTVRPRRGPSFVRYNTTVNWYNRYNYII